MLHETFIANQLFPPLSLSKKQKQKKNLKTRKAMCNVLLRATSVRSDSKNDKNPAGHLPSQS